MSVYDGPALLRELLDEQERAHRTLAVPIGEGPRFRVAVEEAGLAHRVEVVESPLARAGEAFVLPTHMIVDGG